MISIFSTSRSLTRPAPPGRPPPNKNVLVFGKDLPLYEKSVNIRDQRGIFLASSAVNTYKTVTAREHAFFVLLSVLPVIFFSCLRKKRRSICVKYYKFFFFSTRYKKHIHTLYPRGDITFAARKTNKNNINNSTKRE